MCPVLISEVRKDNLAAGTNLQTLPWEKLSQLVMDGQSVDEGRARLVAKVCSGSTQKIIHRRR